MSRYVAFLRGINVSGQKLIKMETLRQYFEMPGIKNVVTYIQSGNVIFDATLAREKLQVKIEKQLAQQLGYSVPVILRTISELEAVIKNNPYKSRELADGAKLYVYFLASSPDPVQVVLLSAYLSSGEAFTVIGRELYFLSTAFGNTKLTLSEIERKLGVKATARNWATVNTVINM